MFLKSNFLFHKINILLNKITKQGLYFLIKTFIFSLICILLWFYFFGPVSWPGTPVMHRWIIVDPGTPVKKIGRQLKECGLIRWAESFHLLSVFTQKTSKLKAGSYFLNSGMSVLDIIHELEKGHSLVYKVTIPEGLTINEIAKLLQERKVISAEAFIAQLKDREFLKNEFGDLSGGKSAEGFLFPDTYEFQHGESARDIIRKMVRRFRQKVDEGLIKQAEEKNLNLVKLVTLASLVEKEAQKEEERTIIAAVFLNRLRKRMPLQSCASVQYVLGKHKKSLTYKDLEHESPYNTYLHTGLPPGPIANPGFASIKAVLNPAQVDYLYFVARPDGFHIFSRTYTEHLAAKRKVKQESRNR